MRYLIVTILLVAVLCFIVSCSEKDDDKGSDYNFQSERELEQFLANHEWCCFLWAEKMEGTPYMEVWCEAVRITGYINPDDNYSMTLNGYDVSIEYWDDDYLGFEDALLPQKNTIEVVFKRDNSVIIDKEITVPAYPSIGRLPATLDWTRPIKVSWSLANDSHFQGFSYSAWNYDDDIDKYIILRPSSRSYEIPANSITLSNIIGYDMDITQINFAEYKNRLVVAVTDDWIYGGDYSNQLRSDTRQEEMHRMRSLLKRKERLTN